MSLSISEIGQVVASLTQDAQTQAGVLIQLGASAGAFSQQFNALVGGSAKAQITNQVIQSYAIAQQALELASNCLLEAAQSGEEWLAENISSGPVNSKPI